MKSTKAILGMATALLLTAARLHAADVGPGVLRFPEPQMTVPEGATTAVVTVQRTSGHAGTVSVEYTASAGTAVPDVDFTPTGGRLTWSGDDSAPKTFTVNLFLSPNRAGKTVILTLHGPTGGATILAGRGQQTLILSASGDLAVVLGAGAGAEDHGEIGFDLHDYAGVSSAGLAVVTVARTAGAGAVSVRYHSENGTATAGTDYTAVSGTLSWGAGDTALKSFLVPLLPDGSGTVRLFLTEPTGGARLSSPRSTALLTISGPGVHPGGSGPGKIRFTSAAYQGVAGDTVTITAERVDGHAGTVSVRYRTADGSGTAGTDYDAATGTLTWGPDEQGPKTFQVATHPNGDGDGKTVLLALYDPTGGATLGEPHNAVLSLLEKNGDTSACADGANDLCLASGRFRVRVTWRTGDGHTGAGHASKLNANSGIFWFFSPDNTEMLIKVLDACSPYNSFWVFYAATTDVSFSVQVTDTRTGLVKTYTNPYGQAALSVTDTGSFATCH